MTEEEMVERCRRGERDAQREFYTETIDRIHRLLLKMTNNEDDAFDLAQETYLRAFTHLGQFDGRSSLQTWLYRIAVNEALKFLKRAKPERERRRPLPADDAYPESRGAPDAQKLDVSAALAALSPKDRIMLLLRYEQGLDYFTIAAVVGCATGTVASRLNRSRRRLRVFLEKGCGDREETRARRHPIRGADPVAKRPTDEQSRPEEDERVR